MCILIVGYLLITGICNYAGYSTDAYGIYLAFIVFIAISYMMLPGSFDISLPTGAALFTSLIQPALSKVMDESGIEMQNITSATPTIPPAKSASL